MILLLKCQSWKEEKFCFIMDTKLIAVQFNLRWNYNSKIKWSIHLCSSKLSWFKLIYLRSIAKRVIPTYINHSRPLIPDGIHLFFWTRFENCLLMAIFCRAVTGTRKIRKYRIQFGFPGPNPTCQIFRSRYYNSCL